MTRLPRHMDNALPVPERIPGDKSMPAERDENLSPSFVSCEIPQKPRLFLSPEELMDLTGDFSSASILGQLVHWSQKARNFELFVAEEKRNVLLPYPSFS
ncbi:MAG: hypothetical protein JNJ47_06585, partial [Alphaproteobacteria bacterium]|nr:hypothetical protein [Alphaproteobacteria bacterium]